MFENCKNSKKKGDAGLGRAIAHYTLRGIPISIPLTDSQDYDLVIDDDGLKRVQVRCTEYKRNGNFNVGLSIKGGNRKGNSVQKLGSELVYDVLFVLTSENEIYIIPREAFAGLNSVLTLSGKYDQYKEQ